MLGLAPPPSPVDKNNLDPPLWRSRGEKREHLPRLLSEVLGSRKLPLLVGKMNKVIQI